MSERRSDEQGNLGKLIAAGADIVGAGAGASIGHLLGGATGAAAGGMYGAMARIMLKDVALDFTYRALGEREQARVGAAVFYFAQKYQERLDAGEQPRQDGFFEDSPDDRSAAKELFEATLLAAQREHQEKKVRFYGNLVANIAFDSTVSRGQANLLIATGEVLTYRQLCTLAFIAAKQVAEGETRYPELKTIPGTKPETFRLKQGQYEGASGTPSTETVALLHEIYDLHSRNMVSTGVDLPGSTYIDPSKLRLMLTGFSLYRFMELWEIDKADIEDVASLLT